MRDCVEVLRKMNTGHVGYEKMQILLDESVRLLAKLDEAQKGGNNAE